MFLNCYHVSNRSILYKLYHDAEKQWDENTLSLTTFLYNVSHHKSTNYSPHYIYTGQQPNLPLDLYLNLREADTTSNIDYVEDLIKALERVTENAFESYKQSLNLNARKNNTRNVDYNAGDRILVRNFRKKSKFDPNFLTNFEIVKRLGKGTYLVKNLTTDRYSKVSTQDIKRDHAHQSYLDTQDERENDNDNDLDETAKQTDESQLENNDLKVDHENLPVMSDPQETRWESLAEEIRGGKGETVTRAGRTVKPPARLTYDN